jgi:hypothetical protein
MPDRDNRMVWDRRKRGHYEVWYLTLTDRPTGAAFWIRYTLESPQAGQGEPYAQLWFTSFAPDGGGGEEARHLQFPIDALSSEAAPFSVSIGEARLTHGSARGAIEGHASWELEWEPAPETHRHLPALAYAIPITSTTLLTPNPGVRFRGRIQVAGRSFELGDATGCQTHLWGRKHAESWAWVSCTTWDGGEQAHFEGITALVKRGGRTLPPMAVVGLTLDGRRHQVNSFRRALKTRSDWELGRWAFEAEGASARVEGEITHPVDALVLAEYHDPDGEPSFCHNSELATLRLRTELRDGRFSAWREGPLLTATGTAHAEWGARAANPSVRRRILPS